MKNILLLIGLCFTGIVLAGCIVVGVDHNSAPRIAGRGSAVFLHLARMNFSATAGCVSMTKSAMLRLLRRMGPHTKIIIG